MAELRARLMKHLEGRREVYFNKVSVSIKQDFIELRDRLASLTAKDTGAAAGIPSSRDLYPSHPAYRMGLTIGNEEGQSGWQIVYTQGRGSNAKYVLRNPMWTPYLQFLEYGVIKSAQMTPGTLRAEWRNFQSRDRNK